MRSVILITAHHFCTKRRAGFHHISETLQKSGWNVTFMTVAYSWLARFSSHSHLKEYKIEKEANRLKEESPGLSSYLYYRLIHPVNFTFHFGETAIARIVNWLFTPIFKLYGNRKLDKALKKRVEEADLFIFESSVGLLLFDRFKKMNPQAKCLYRVSDDIRYLNVHPTVIKAEKRVAPLFDSISFPSPYTRDTFQKEYGENKKYQLLFHGVDVSLFESEKENPYKGGFNVLFVGTNNFNQQVVRWGAESFPHWNFHIVGPFQEESIKRDNVTFYGSLPFKETIKFIKFADIGVGPHVSGKGAESITGSLKLLQYCYAKLPTILPKVLQYSIDWPNLMFYTLEKDSVVDAFQRAGKFDKKAYTPDHVLSWDSMTEALLAPLNLS